MKELVTLQPGSCVQLTFSFLHSAELKHRTRCHQQWVVLPIATQSTLALATMAICTPQLYLEYLTEGLGMEVPSEMFVWHI